MNRRDNICLQSSIVTSEIEVNVAEETDLLNKISSYFSVKSTTYGGRGCFAANDLNADTIIHECSFPLSSLILRSFKKQVCEYCFTYLNGKILKYKLILPSNEQHHSTLISSFALYFCSEVCMNTFISLDIDHLYLKSLLLVESHFVKGLNRKEYNLERINEQEKAEVEMTLELENELKQNKNIELFISNKWEQAEIDCQSILSKVKAKQRKNLYHLIPSIDENEYLDIKYIIGILFQIYKQDKYQKISFELEILEFLQSNDVAKICKYPYLLYSYIKIYKFLKISTIDQLQPYVTPSRIRSIIGKCLTNAFGIRSLDEPNGYKQFFGYALYPSASFFNHSCQPNVIHMSIGSKKIFKLLKNVKKNEELLINYVPFDMNTRFETRQEELNEWFFNCSCQQCLNEK